MKFLRNFLASILGTLFAFGIIFVMFLIFASLASVEEPSRVKENSVLQLQMEYPLVDYAGNDASDPFAGLFEQRVGLDEVLHAIAVAKDDDDIRGISIENNFFMGGLSQAKAVRDALLDFKASGKFIYAYGDFFFQKDYYLSSVADSVFINPVGMVEFKGLAAEVLYMKELQEKSGVKIEVVRHGKYKSAVEPFLSDEMSASNREQIQELLGSLWGSMLDDIAMSRKLERETLDEIASSRSGRMPAQALQAGLVDGLSYRDEYKALLLEASGRDADDDLHGVTLDDYREVAKKKRLYKGDDEVALLFAQGEILYAEGGPDMIGQEIMVNTIRKIREDEDIKAVVLRVNSPGGSALVSDIIWREIELTKAVKPVVVSMGDVAASGGYYIACGADRIFAEPTTITGSIGVFGTLPNIHELADDIGVNAEQVYTNPEAADYSIFEPLSEQYREVVRAEVENIYETFLQRVAEGRSMPISKVDSLAQGRVWSGIDAQRAGLVDEIGGLDEAVAAAAELAEMETYKLKKFPRYKSNFTRLMEDLGAAESKQLEQTLKNELGPDLYGILKELRTSNDQPGVKARLPFTLNIR